MLNSLYPVLRRGKSCKPSEALLAAIKKKRKRQSREVLVFVAMLGNRLSLAVACIYLQSSPGAQRMKNFGRSFPRVGMRSRLTCRC